ncbi:hypothetical protein T02_3440 [Trichinella nativa]|uniref:Uncharacterized protein n=1 Tax=Trichinella nativa TaxID=6335 RepID=A0A0V1LSH6_9BILA|nr:hypothetical protein T02_3440 [Trichinella nativa]
MLLASCEFHTFNSDGNIFYNWYVSAIVDLFLILNISWQCIFTFDTVINWVLSYKFGLIDHCSVFFIVGQKKELINHFIGCCFLIFVRLKKQQVSNTTNSSSSRSSSGGSGGG